MIENTQRDLNIALMNELALICDRLGIRTRDVLRAAATKWNFLPFTPGLVGGHCIGVDPYYLTAKAESLGYHPEVILAGRRINDGMGGFVAQKLVKLLIAREVPVRRARVGVLGLTFKENVPTCATAACPTSSGAGELRHRGQVHDPLADEARQGRVRPGAGPWRCCASSTPWCWRCRTGPISSSASRAGGDAGAAGILVDVRSALDPARLPATLTYWSL